MLYFRRDDNNKLVGFDYNNEKYYYKKNNQNDIIGIYNNSYDLIASYEYDSYGRILKVVDENENIITDENHIAMINPYRYRSYYYDEETNLYYLNSRYYNPVWKRFINRDNYIGYGKSPLSCNLYLYCENNPVNNSDVTGMFFKKKFNSIKNAVVNTINIFKNLYNSGEKLYQKLKNSFTAEVGIGVGVGGGISNKASGFGLDFGVHKTFNTGISNNTVYNSTTSEAAATVSIKSKEIGLGYDITHYDDGNRIHDNIMAMPWEVYDCQNTTKDITFGVQNAHYGSIEINSEKFIGIDIEAYAMIGGHIKIGFNW